MAKRVLAIVLLAGVGWLLSGHWLAAQKADQPPRVKANNAVALRELVGREVTVYGQVESTGESSSGHQFLNFHGKQVSAFCPKEVVARFNDGTPAEKYKNKDVEVTGSLSLFNGKLQLKILRPADVKEIDLDDEADRLPKPIELKQVSREVWLSPAGLRYRGRDPEGLNRVEHILRHVKDIPDRDGPHGVFDGGEGVAFALIDEAWQLARERKLRPEAEGDRSSYVVFMNRRVGYLGGRAGKERGHPPLSRIFIVFETDTNNIITAFPR